jgi:hypothetical protein
MNLVTSFQNFATRVGQEFKSVRTLLNNNQADLTALNTTAKGSIVAAINEVNQSVGALAGGEAAALATKVDFSTAQTLTSPQKTQVLGNIGAVPIADIGDINTDFVAAFNTALV